LTEADEGVLIVTDGWTAPQSGGGRTAPWSNAPPDATAWWSDALDDPWRDPDAPARLVVNQPADPPALETENPMSAPRRHSLALVVLVSLITALLAAPLGGTLVYVYLTRGGGPAAPGPQLGGSAPLTQRAPDSLAGVVKKILPSVVTVRVRAGSGSVLGSGFIVSSDGYLITNDHVVTGSTSATVTFSDSSNATARIVGSDPQSDIAVLKIDQSGLAPVEFGNSDSVQVGDPVLAIGSPLALANTVTFGIVSAVDRPVQAEDPGGPTRYYAAIQTDAAINHGNSGGPLVDGAGRVIGINSVITSPATGDQQAGNVGLAFAIPINQAKRVAQEIIATGKARRTVIGAELENSYRSPDGGVRLQTVEPNGPAAAAGLRVGDILMRLDGHPLEEPGDLVALVRKYAPGNGVKIDYVRTGSHLTTQVTLAADAN
jgi:putative serine protease PepD